MVSETAREMTPEVSQRLSPSQRSKIRGLDHSSLLRNLWICGSRGGRFGQALPWATSNCSGAWAEGGLGLGRKTKKKAMN